MTPTASKRQLGASASAIWTQPAEVCHVFILPVLGRAHCCPARCESQPSESRRLLDASAGPWEPISGHSGEPARPRFSCAGLCAPPRAGSIHCTPRGRPKPTAELRGRSGYGTHTAFLSPFSLHRTANLVPHRYLLLSQISLPMCSFIACSCYRERCIQDFLHSGFPFLTLHSNTS